MSNLMTKQAIMTALHAFTIQRPGLDFANYGDVTYYRQDSRKITQQLNDYYKLAYFVNTRDSIPAEYLASRLTGSERLSMVNDKLNYTTGQYWPTEYRAAVCRLLSSAIWQWFRDDCGYATADAIRKAARREFGRGLAGRWFN